MKNLKLLVVALVAMFGFIACDKHECNDHDHSADLVGTWTCLTADYAEALVIKADGSALSTGYDGVDYWENVAGKVVVANGIVTMTFEDNDNFKGHFDIVPGMAFSIYTDEGERYTYNYCKEDLTEEVVGRWVWVDSNGKGSENMGIQTFNENGTGLFTGGYEEIDYKLNEETTYKVVGDLLIQNVPNDNPPYMVRRLTYNANGSSYGAILTTYSPATNYTASWLRIKQNLNLTGTTYDYSSAYVSNAKGKDEDFSILGHTFNIAKIGAGDFDMMLRSVLFCLDTDANSIKQHFLVDGVEGNIETPIAVDGNKVTIDYSDVNHALRKVEMYMYQDGDDSCLHMYMHTDGFINYFANLEVVTLLQAGKINQSDAAAIEKVFTDMEARIESINVSFVFKVRK